MRHSINALTVVVAVLVSSCSGLGTKTFREFNVNEGTSVSIDATQRVIIVKDGADGMVVCAEPSPDALVAAAAQVAAKGQAPGTGAGEFSGGISQSAASIGIRTATIQLLRDGYFRACEATMNGLLDWESYQGILNGITPVIVGLVAIDGLTQMGHAPLASVSAGGSASTTSDGTSVTATAAQGSGAGTSGGADPAPVASQVVSIVEMVLKDHQMRQEMMFDYLKKKSAR